MARAVGVETRREVGHTLVMEWVSEIQQANWVREALDDFLLARVSSLVPRGFGAYACLVHPARGWGDLANAFDMPPSRTPGGGLQPAEGTLTIQYARRLVEVLRPYTDSGDTCWFGLWDGFGWEREGTAVPPHVLNGPKLELPYRSYLIYRGGLEDALAFQGESDQTPNIWWPDSRQWFVATEIDLRSSYIGGSAELIQRLRSDSLLKAGLVSETDVRSDPPVY